MTTTVAEGTIWQATVDDVPVALTVGGRLVAVAGAEGTCAIFDTTTGERVTSLSVDGGLLDAALSSDGTHLALTSTAGYHLWHARDTRLETLRAESWSARARWAGTDRVAVAAGRQIAVHAADGAPLWQAGPAPSTITDLTWVRQGREIAVSAYNGVYRYARHRTDPVGHFPYPGSHLVIAATGNDRWICTGNQDRSVHIWRTRDAKELEMAGYPDKVTHLTFDDTGRWLANNGAPDITVWDFAGKGPAGTSPRMLRHHDAVTDLAWRPGTGATLASCARDATVALWQPSTGTPGKPMKPTRRYDLDAPATAVAWLDQRRLLTATRTGTLTVIDTAAARPKGAE
jgi:WD40 repeat protein